MDYNLNLGAWNSVFAVPTAVVDDYIKLAGGNNLKVLLIILRNAGKDISVETIARGSGISPDDVQDALLFWEQTGLLALNNGQIIPAKAAKPVQADEKIPRPQEPEPSDNAVFSSVKKVEAGNNSLTEAQLLLNREPRFYPKEIAKAVRDDKGVDFMFKECERIYGRPLKPNEQNSLMLMTEETGIPAECALMLVEYCFSISKATPGYMKAIAIDWLERGIITIGAVEAEIKVLRDFNSLENRLRRLFEMNSAFSKVQREYIKKWADLGYDDEMLNEAYQITLDNAGRLAFPYMNKVIIGWSANGIKNKEQLERSQKARKDKAQKEENSKSSFDIDKISRLFDER